MIFDLYGTLVDIHTDENDTVWEKTAVYFGFYGAHYTVLLANRADEKGRGLYTIAGRCCESGDLIGENIELPTPNVGDTLAVLVTGAYNYSMSSNYNCIPRPIP